ncbi:uncharacterized protein LOC125189552 [Salvia hispanica]|uniref:uncharacterized protein LOC125189552 n=1 Tax=Salvia hispanica TaxID=49212 RepID=UPI002009A649|nr:uncharacterized protein LOC125189552 [Salvia hispanica]
MEKIKANPHIPLAAIRQCVDEDFGLKIGRMKAYRAREHALDDIFGSAATQYKNLFYYKVELERTHPDSSVHIHYENSRDSGTVGPRFLRFYCCLGPLKKGWKQFCRPIIFFDACFLRGMYKGQLMTTMGIDPNNGWWPIAWAVTETESYVQWKWFVEYLSDVLELHANDPRYVFMSDQQKGLAKVIVEEFPQSEHRFCVQHIYNNFKKRSSGKISKNGCGKLLRIEYPQAHQWLTGVAPKEKLHWLERKQLSACWRTFAPVRWKEFRSEGQWIKIYDHAVPPVIKELVDKWYSQASSWRATWNGESSYQVTGPSGLWQLTGIPCTHAIATINKNGEDVTRYVSRYYLKSTMSMLYENVFYPINGVDNWPKSSYGALELAPPRSKRQRGRPKKLRREEPQIRLHADGDARAAVGESSQHTGSRERGESTFPESSNNRQRQEPNVSDPGPSTRTRARTHPQRCGRRGDQD